MSVFSKKYRSFISRGLFWAALCLSFPLRSFACSACGCSVSSDRTVQGAGLVSGSGLEVRYDYIDQSDLRHGTHSVDRTSLGVPNDEEIQQVTLGRMTWASASYAVSDAWQITAQLPYISRFHSTILPGETDITSVRTHGLGDVRLLAGYAGFTVKRDFGLQFGLKLPTGRFDQDFEEGPGAGTLLDRGLQAGTGTTDVMLGMFKFGSLTPSFGYFAQAMLDQPLAQRDQFIPGTSVNLNAGLRTTAWRWIEPQLQIDAHVESREAGAQADHDNSGATQIFATPGVVARVAPKADAYAFVQLPLYQRVNGLQLEARWLLSLGVRWRL